jgi:hypothetical protein
MLDKRELAETALRPLALDSELLDRMINKLCMLSDGDLAERFMKSCKIRVSVVSAGKFMFKY